MNKSQALRYLLNMAWLTLVLCVLAWGGWHIFRALQWELLLGPLRLGLLFPHNNVDQMIAADYVSDVAFYLTALLMMVLVLVLQRIRLR